LWKKVQIDATIKLQPLYQWQKDISNPPNQARHVLCCVSRRAGKTTACTNVAIRALIAGKRILWVSPLYSQSIEIYRTILNKTSEIVKYQACNKELILHKGGQIWFRSSDNPDSLRSLGYDCCLFDEMAFSNEESWKVLRPTLAERQGKLIGISTPNGFNWWHDLWEKVKDNPDWYCFQSDYKCSPHLKEEEIEKMKLEMSVGEFNQEMNANFVQSKGSLFEGEWLKDIMVDELPELFQRKSIAVDLSLGNSIYSDFQAVAFTGWFNNCLYVDIAMKRMAIPVLLNYVKEMYLHYKPESIGFESNGYQCLVADAFSKLFPIPPAVMLIDNKVKKETRIGRLGQLLKNKQLKILRNEGGNICFGQLSDWGSGENHDDGPDAIEMSWRILVET